MFDSWRFILAAVAVITVVDVVLSQQNFKLGIMYGDFTNKNDLYKNLFTDASTFVNRDNSFLNGGQDTLSIFNYAPIDGVTYNIPNDAQTVRAACTFASSVDMSALVTPSDICTGCGGNSGRIVGNAFTPVFALDQSEGSNAYKMLPIDSELMELWISVIDHYKWQDFIFVYDTDSAYSLAMAMLALQKSHSWHVIPYELLGDYSEMAKDLKKRRTQNYLLYVHYEELLPGLISWMLEDGMFGDKYHWIFGNIEPPISRIFLDDKLRIHTSFLTRFKMQVIGNVDQDVFTRNPQPPRLWPFRQRTAYDSVVFFARALTKFREDNGRYPRAIPKCGENQESELAQTLQTITHEGLSGEVAFNENGDRVNYTVDIFMGKDKHNILQAGIWTQNIDHYERKTGTKWAKGENRLNMNPFRQSDQSYIKVLSIEEPPFLMLSDHDYNRAKRQATPPESTNAGLDRYVGIIPELLVHIKKIFEEELQMEFDYRIELVAEGYYGKRNPNTGEWDGIVKELQDSDADLAAGAFTVTNPREDVIDFTKQFVKSNIKVLVKHPNWVRDHPFNFAFAFHWDVWLVNLFAFGITIAVVWLLMKLHPLEYRKLAVTGQATREQANEFTLRNSAWMLTSIMFFQKYKMSPRTNAGRILLASWFFFFITMLFLYMFNLNDFIILDKTVLFLGEPSDLLNEPLLKIGMVRNGPTHDFYTMSSKAADQQLMTLMGVLDRDPFVERMRDGAIRVRNDNGHYALVSEEILMSFYSQRGPWCDLYIVGDPFKKIKYAFATPSGSPLRDQVTYAINQLKKRGVLEELTTKQWFGPQKCENDSLWESESVLSINGNDLEGLYYILGMGLVLSVIIFLIDVLCYYLYGSCSSTGGGSAIAAPPRTQDEGMHLTTNPAAIRRPKGDEFDYGGSKIGTGASQANEWM